MPVRSGVQVLYGVFAGTEPITGPDGWTIGAATDYTMRQAWTANREFHGAVDFQTGLAPQFLLAFEMVSILANDRPLVVGVMTSNTLEFDPSLSSIRGYSREGGSVPWQGQSQPYFSMRIADFSAIPTSDGGAWATFVDFRDGSFPCGHSGCDAIYFDPVLMVGKLTLE